MICFMGYIIVRFMGIVNLFLKNTRRCQHFGSDMKVLYDLDSELAAGVFYGYTTK
ncbi:MAG: hypothetical protein LUG62_00450 [Clostridiales bacterium]|nr:hypothetical protein [Clostridiales bacterium]